MKILRNLALAGAVSALSLSSAMAQTAPGPYTPSSGQAGKDVVWVPTQDTLVQNMLDMAAVTKDDYVVDLGSGDGRTVIAAAKRGAKAHGIEFNPDLVAHAKENAEKAGVNNATFAQGDIFETDFSDATVVTLFLLNSLNEKLRPTLLDMKPGTRVVSNTFTMGDWQQDDEVNLGSNCTSFCRAYKWIIPAKVGGSWQLDKGQLELTQKYQMLDGTLTVDSKASPINDAKMNGSEIVFTANGKTYRGTVNDRTMTGEIEGGGSWTAQRSN